MYSDISGKYAVLNYNITGNSSLLNHIQKTSTSLKMFKQSIGSILFGNMSYTITISDENPKLFYSYSNYGYDSVKYGTGINVYGWFGLEMFAATPGDIGIGTQITPWVHSSAQIGLSGIGITIGIDNDRTAYDVSLNIGWGTVGLIALASAPIPGARTVAVTTALILFVLGWINEGDGGYYF